MISFKKCVFSFFLKQVDDIPPISLHFLMNQNIFITILIFDLLGCSVPDSPLVCNSFF